jgi:hypothetical protein
MFLFSSSKKSIELKGTPVLEWIFWKWSVLCVQLEKISCTIRLKRKMPLIRYHSEERWRKRTVVYHHTWATNIDLMLSLSRNVFAISAVGDREAMARLIPFSFNAYNMPLAWGYNDGISRLERHSLKKHRFNSGWA